MTKLSDWLRHWFILKADFSSESVTNYDGIYKRSSPSFSVPLRARSTEIRSREPRKHSWASRLSRYIWKTDFNELRNTKSVAKTLRNLKAFSVALLPYIQFSFSGVALLYCACARRPENTFILCFPTTFYTGAALSRVQFKHVSDSQTRVQKLHSYAPTDCTNTGPASNPKVTVFDILVGLFMGTDRYLLKGGFLSRV